MIPSSWPLQPIRMVFHLEECGTTCSSWHWASGLWLHRMSWGTKDRSGSSIKSRAPLVVSMAIIAMAEVTRSVRWVNVALGLWLMLAPVLMGYEPLHIGVHSALIGGAILLLSLVKGPEREQRGGRPTLGNMNNNGRRPDRCMLFAGILLFALIIVGLYVAGWFSTP